MRWHFSASLSLLVAGSIAVPTKNGILHEKRESRSLGKAARVESDSVIPIRIGLVQSNLDGAYGHLMGVSHPESLTYGQHWSKEQVDHMFAPSDESTEVVKEWLISSGISADAIATSRNRGWLAIDMPASQAEALLNTQYHEYENAHDGSVRIGCDEYHIPAHVARHVDLIKPAVVLSPPLRKRSIQKRDSGLRFPRPESLSYKDSVAQTCGDAITPDCIKAMYNIPNATINAADDPYNALGIFETEGAYSRADLNAYYAKHAPWVPSHTYPYLNSINNGSAPASQANADGESDIDFEMAFSLVYPQNIFLYEVGDLFPDNDTFITTFLDAIDEAYCTSSDISAGADCGIYNLTNVISLSYTSPELFTEDGTFRSQIRDCNEIMKLSLQGHTIIVSSGDYGVAAHPQPNANGCASADGKDPSAHNGTLFQPQFPANCPYVLSVGATQLTSGQTANDAETTMNPGSDIVSGAGVGATFSSSGGFSNIFPAPDYQSSALSAYFSVNDPGYPSYSLPTSHPAKTLSGVGAKGGIYNRAGRGIPDVSANGAFFASVIGGADTLEFGTSLAAPLWGAVVTLLNEERAAKGKAPLGFLQPVLYANTGVFNDITTGSNPGCGTDGFPAVEGWDPSTGLGTPVYPLLLEAVLALP